MIYKTIPCSFSDFHEVLLHLEQAQGTRRELNEYFFLYSLQPLFTLLTVSWTYGNIMEEMEQKTQWLNDVFS